MSDLHWLLRRGCGLALAGVLAPFIFTLVGAMRAHQQVEPWWMWPVADGAMWIGARLIFRPAHNAHIGGGER